MERFVKYAAALLGLVVTAGLIGAGVSEAVADGKVAPVATKVAVLEAQRVEDVKAAEDVKKRLERIEKKLDAVLARGP